MSSAAPPGAIDCGTGHDFSSDATVYQCGSSAIIRRRPFYCTFLPWPGLSSDIVTSTTQSSVGYIGDAAQAIAAVVHTLPDSFRTIRVWPNDHGCCLPLQPLRGMQLPRFASAARPYAHPRGVLIIEVAVTTFGRVSDAAVLKSLSPDIDGRALALVRGSVLEPGRLFGIAVPLITTLAVDLADHTLTIRAPTPRRDLSSPQATNSPLHPKN